MRRDAISSKNQVGQKMFECLVSRRKGLEGEES